MKLIMFEGGNGLIWMGCGEQMNHFILSSHSALGKGPQHGLDARLHRVQVRDVGG